MIANETMFLSLKDAVEIAVREFGIDKTLAEHEFEQKCYCTSDQYQIGFDDGLEAADKAIKKMIKDRIENSLKS